MDFLDLDEIFYLNHKSVQYHSLKTDVPLLEWKLQFQKSLSSSSFYLFQDI